MKTLHSLLFVAVSFLVVAVADARPPAAAPGAVTVLCFGDSITAGSALKSSGGGAAWPTLVESLSNGKFHTMNAGRAGRLTSATDEFDTTLKNLREKPDVLLVALGTNDSRGNSGTCVPNAVANIQKMITMAREAYPQIRILIVGPTNLRKDTLKTHSETADQRDKNLQDLNAAYEKLAKETKGDFVSMYGLVPSESLSVDGIHPDAAGNIPMAKAILGALEKQSAR